MNPSLPRHLSRRQFLELSGLAAGALALGGCADLAARSAASGKLRVAVIGLGSQGVLRLREALRCGANIIALCDVDELLLRAAQAMLPPDAPKARTYTDHRKLFAAEAALEAVIIATPDHWHAPLVKAALAHGKHVFCEKPLTRTIAEARALRELVRTSKAVTQMGNQGSAAHGMRRGIEVIQAGAIGAVREAHVWVPPSGSFKAGQNAPTGSDPVPAELHWDEWLGPAAARAYKKGAYHPKAWRAWYDFGGGSMADWGCHGMNLPVRALRLEYPTRVAADALGARCDGYPNKVRVRFDFAARGELPPVTVWWYDGGRRPDPKLIPPALISQLGENPKAGVLMLGEQGFTFGDPHGGASYLKLAGEKKISGILNHAATQSIAATLPRSPGHMQEWLDACRTGATPFSNFETGGLLTEIVLAGVVALRAGKPLDWDGPAMRATNAPEAEQFVHANYRKGWN